jgi:hypothetical protein
MIPAYQIRVGKAADRLLFRDLLLRVSGVLNLPEYRYIGLGGPFLEDFRLIHDTFPTMKLSSIEKNQQVWSRQKFHKPAKHVALNHCGTDHYFANIYDPDEHTVVWLDYTDLNHVRLREIWGLIKKMSVGSILRVTLRAEGSDLIDHAERAVWVADVFGDYVPDWAANDVERNSFPAMLLRGLRRIVNSATADAHPREFQILNAVYYNDGTQMLTFTGVVGGPSLVRQMRSALRTWSFSNFDWSDPALITLPALSLKERLLLEPLLPSRAGTGRSLHNKLGYSIELSEAKSVEALDNYRRLSEAYPRFARLAF